MAAGHFRKPLTALDPRANAFLVQDIHELKVQRLWFRSSVIIDVGFPIMEADGQTLFQQFPSPRPGMMLGHKFLYELKPHLAGHIPALLGG